MCFSSNEFSNEATSSAFRRLHGHDLVPSPSISRISTLAAWVALVLLTLFIGGIGWLVLDNEQSAERVRLKRSAELVVRTMESRLLATTEDLRRSSPPLFAHGTDLHADEARRTALDFMAERREVLELALVDRAGTVRADWCSDVQPVTPLFERGLPLPSQHAAISALSALELGASEISNFYMRPGMGQVYADLAVPSARGGAALIARINVSKLLVDAAEQASASDYQYRILVDGRPLLPPNEETSPLKRYLLSYEVPIAFLGFSHAGNATLVVENYLHAVFSNHKLSLIAVFGLGAMLMLAVGFLIYFQRLQHRAHQMLSAEYSLRRAMSESAVVGLRVTDRQGRILFVNETFQKIVGWSAEDLLDRTPPYPYWDEPIDERTELLLSDPSDHTEAITLRARRKSGDAFYAEMRLSPLRTESGRTIGCIGALYDITPRILAQERLEAAHERFMLVVESMNSLIAVLDPDERTNLLFANASYARYFGEDAAGAVRLLAKMEATPKSVLGEGIYDEPSKQWFDVREKVIIWTDSQPALLLVAANITVRRELEISRDAIQKRVEATNRLVTMGEMASSLAHELNQPLAAISNYAGGAMTMLESGKLSAERAKEAFRKIENQAQRTGRIIQRIRGFGKKSDPNLEPVDVSSVLQETMELALLQARKLEAAVAVDAPSELPKILGDAVMIEQLLLNLLKNAMEAVRESDNRTVELRVRAEAAGVRFSVVDHGPGIAPAQKQELFDAFYSTKANGMGMGLNICRSIAELHGSRIEVDDTPGGGATFSFLVPLAAKKA